MFLSLFSVRVFSISLLGGLALAGCASVPHGAATKLADAGIATTSSIGSSVTDTSTQVRDAHLAFEFQEAFKACETRFIDCSSGVLPPDDDLDADIADDEAADETAANTDRLADLILVRARAANALGNAYRALKTEAEYDASADLEGATKDAFAGVNRFASGVSAITGGTPGTLLSSTVVNFAGKAAGAFAARRQKQRLYEGSEQIARATLLFRQSLNAEAEIFDGISENIVRDQAEARKALLRAGMISYSDLLESLTDTLDARPVGGIDRVLNSSPNTRAALLEMLDARTRREIEQRKRTYRASIAALDALLNAHGDFGASGSVGLEDFDRALADLEALIPPPEEKR